MPRQDPTIQIRGVDELGQHLKLIASERELIRVAGYAFRRTAPHIRSEMVDKGRSRGVLRSVFGGNRRRRVGLNRAIKLHRVKKVAGDFQAKLNTLGGAGALVDIQETGGRFRPHVIAPSTAPKLAFRVDGRLIVTSQVQHPGATHPRIPVFWPAVRESAVRLRKETAEALHNYFRGKAVR